MRKTGLFTASLLLAGTMCVTPMTQAETNAYAVLTELPEGGSMSYVVGLESSEHERDLPAYSHGLEYWEAIRTGIPLTGNIGQDVLAIARSQVGYMADRKDWVPDKEGLESYTRYGDWYGYKYCDWCDAFVSFCVYYAGLTDYPSEMSCMRHEADLKAAGYWRDWNEYIPSPGDIAFLSLDSGVTFASHVGIIEMILPATEEEPAKLVMIEGNVATRSIDPTSVVRIIRSFDDVVGYATYTKSNSKAISLNCRNDNDPCSMLVSSEPVWDVLEFIGATDTVYAHEKFPEKFLEPEEAGEIEKATPKDKGYLEN